MSEISPQITLGQYSTDPNRPDYACPAYRDMLPGWQIVEDVREGTDAMRRKRTDYLPKFEAEEEADWDTRVGLTFASDSYAMTLEEHVGLVMSEAPKPSEDMPDPIREIVETDFNGEGDSLEVFASDTVDSAMHFGHAVLWTDYPDVSVFPTNREKLAAKVRPYAVLYTAPNVLNWVTVNVGGAVCLAQIMFREFADKADAGLGGVTTTRYRQVTQQVIRDAASGRPVGLGAITWRAWERVEGDGDDDFIEVTEGPQPLVGPSKIPARVIYGGRKVAFLVSRPHLKGIAYTSLEETQVKSDYAYIMHKCNVPTAVFVGREPGPSDKAVKMGAGIDIPMGGTAMFLEPAGTAIKATESRLDKLALQMQRQGATTSDGGGKVLTATEAMMVAKSRNAKLRRAATSAEKAFNGSLEDMGAFSKIEKPGKVELSTEFAGVTLDPQYLGVLTKALELDSIPIDAYLYALEKGRLPEDFSATEAALRLIAEAEANAELEDGGAEGDEGEGDEGAAA